MGIIEILALILIVISVIKIVTLLIHPESWFVFTKKVFVKPKVTSTVALILAAAVLYFLIRAGTTILEILAVTLFIALFMTVGLVKYLPDMVKKIKPKTVLKEQWLYTLAWIALLVWGIVVLI